MCGCLSHTSYQTPGLQPGHVPWLVIEPLTLWFTGWNSIHWATPAMARHSFLTLLKHWPSSPDMQSSSLWPWSLPSSHNDSCGGFLHFGGPAVQHLFTPWLSFLSAVLLGCSWEFPPLKFTHSPWQRWQRLQMEEFEKPVRHPGGYVD